MRVYRLPANRLAGNDFASTTTRETFMKKSFKFGLAAMMFATGAAGIALAQQADIIKLRQRIMDTNGQAAKVAVGMLKGEIPYDATIAASAALSISHDLDVFPNLFPAGSDQGETKASPDIWTNMDDFKAIAAKMVSDAKAAADAAAQGKDAFSQAFDAVGGDCKACHEKYRKS
jgi:cytochrome c556